MDWLDQLKQAVDKSSCAEVARQLGVSRSAVSLLVNGKYQGDPRRMARRVQEFFSRVICPENGLAMSRGQCRANLGNDAPTSSPAALRLWKACRRCPFKPLNLEEKTDDSGKNGKRVKGVKKAESGTD